MEAIYVLECIAPLPLHVDRFLPPTPVRVCLDQRGGDAGNSVSREMLSRCLRRGDAGALFELPGWREAVLPALIERAWEMATARVPDLIARARMEMAAKLDHEITRLQALRQVNRSVRLEEIELLTEQKRAMIGHLNGARLRLDAIRLIRRGTS